ncbi:MAG: tyrosine-type recombinase/integrase [Chloroflexi bacterium]|nr:tyrosine-type recombinase/integrase [Chloroflexota bacterium]
MKRILGEFLLCLEAAGRSPRTLATYQERLGYVVAFLVERGIEKIADVRPDHLDAYVVGLRRRELSPVTIAGRIMVIKTFLAWCVRRRYLERSPADHLKKPRLERGGRSPPMARGDLALLIREAVRGRPRDLAVLLFLADTGCRVGELVRLKVGDVRLADLEARVDGKTGGRWVDFTERTRCAVEVWLSSRDGPSTGSGCDVGESLFGMTANGVRKMLERLGARAGVAGRVNPHSIRHLVGQAWLDDGANLELVRQKLGHRDITTTAMFYAHQDRERVKAASERYSLVNGENG